MFWWRGPPFNFGDWIGPWLYRARTGRDPVFRVPSARNVTTTLVTVGSISELLHEDCVVWGAGILSRSPPVHRPHRTLAVRGPLTRARYLNLGYACPDVYGDPAILLPRYLDGAGRAHGPLAVVPNFKHLEEAERLLGGRPDVVVIDVRRPVEEVVAELTSFEHVAASSLHGLVVAHAYGIPAVHVDFESRIDGDGVKFEDYYRSGGVDDVPSPVRVTAGTTTAELCEAAARAPLPELESLVPELLAYCPF